MRQVTSWMRNLRHREVKWLTQGHPGLCRIMEGDEEISLFKTRSSYHILLGLNRQKWSLLFYSSDHQHDHFTDLQYHTPLLLQNILDSPCFQMCIWPVCKYKLSVFSFGLWFLLALGLSPLWSTEQFLEGCTCTGRCLGYPGTLESLHLNTCVKKLAWWCPSPGWQAFSSFPAVLQALKTAKSCFKI